MPSHNMIYNNVSSNNPFSIWSDDNNFFSVNNSYNNPVKNSYILKIQLFDYRFQYTRQNSLRVNSYVRMTTR